MPEIVMYGNNWCPDCSRAKAFLKDHGIAYTWINIDQDEAAAVQVERLAHGNRSVPTIVFPDGSVLIEPSNAQLAKKLEV
jgi:mycoredoxin